MCTTQFYIPLFLRVWQNELPGCGGRNIHNLPGNANTHAWAPQLCMEGQSSWAFSVLFPDSRGQCEHPDKECNPAMEKNRPNFLRAGGKMWNWWCGPTYCRTLKSMPWNKGLSLIPQGTCFQGELYVENEIELKQECRVFSRCAAWSKVVCCLGLRGIAVSIQSRVSCSRSDASIWFYSLNYHVPEYKADIFSKTYHSENKESPYIHVLTTFLITLFWTIKSIWGKPNLKDPQSILVCTWKGPCTELISYI